MPWLNHSHRCAIPEVPRNYGAGSQWKCGDIGTDGCGLVYEVSESNAPILVLMDPQPIDGIVLPVDGPVPNAGGLEAPTGGMVLG